jgi:hypothetical protein
MDGSLMATVEIKDLLDKVREQVESQNPRRYLGSDSEDRDKYEDQAEYETRIDEIINDMTVLELLTVLSEIG